MVVVGTITGNFLTLVQTKISAQGNMSSWEWGRAVGLVLALGTVGVWCRSGDSCVPAEAGIGLRLSFVVV